MPFTNGIDEGGQGYIGISGSGMPSQLMKILEQDAIDPGADIGYEACKIIYSYHPLGARMVDKPLQMAMSQERKIEVPGAPEELLLKAFKREWKRIGGIGADTIIYRAAQLSFIYGISTLFVNVLNKDGTSAPFEKPLDYENLWKEDLYFNLYDPLTTAGSLVLNQDPLAVDYMHPKQVSVSGQPLSNTKTLVMMHEQPIWIQWTNSAFGFVGRSVYQRAFFPLKSFVVSMLADQMVQDKLGLLVYKTKSPGSILDRAALSFKRMQRAAIGGARTNNVLSIGESEDLASLNLEHVREAGEYTRRNILVNIATAAGQPAQFLTQETLAEGFGEGSEDAKQIAQYIDRVRFEMGPAFEFMDRLVQRRAWNPVFYEEIQRRFPEQYGGVPYAVAFQDWCDAFTATWPNLLTEPDSEKAKAAQSRLESATKLATTLLSAPIPQETVGAICQWLADVANDEKEFYSSPLLIDGEEIAEHEPLPADPIEEDAGQAKGNIRVAS
ncbi:MAG: hypothetical protein ACP5D5_09145 [Acidithiobacillus sp.]|uniref:hypothetical protein n=1 Tax=Acidithiobacillus sp. TaxID=1872118 RepID=UPI003D088828